VGTILTTGAGCISFSNWLSLKSRTYIDPCLVCVRYSTDSWQQDAGSVRQAPGLFKARFQVDGEPADTFVYMKVNYLWTCCAKESWTFCKLKRTMLDLAQPHVQVVVAISKATRT